MILSVDSPSRPKPTVTVDCIYRNELTGEERKASIEIPLRPYLRGTLN